MNLSFEPIQVDLTPGRVVAVVGCDALDAVFWPLICHALREPPIAIVRAVGDTATPEGSGCIDTAVITVPRWDPASVVEILSKRLKFYSSAFIPCGDEFPIPLFMDIAVASGCGICYCVPNPADHLPEATTPDEERRLEWLFHSLVPSGIERYLVMKEVDGRKLPLEVWSQA